VSEVSNSEYQDEIRQRTEEYRVLHEVAKVINGGAGLAEMLQRIMKAIVGFGELKVEYKAGVFLADAENRKLDLFSWIGAFSDEFLDKEKSIPYGNCLCGRVAESGEMIISESCFTDERHENRFRDMTAHGHYIVPLKHGADLIGVLFLYTDENPPWYSRSQDILLSIGGLIAGAIVAKRREEEVRLSNQKLKELNELKNKFLGIASHDLRNPLYLILSYSEVLKDGSVGPVSEKQGELLRKIHNSSQYMKALLENLLDISKIESGKIELDKKVQDLNAIARTQVELCQLLAEKKNITVRFEPGPVPPISFDGNAIIQVMGNFLTNAIKFSPAGTEVRVTTEEGEGHVRFSVADQGPGVPEEEQKRLFEEFQTLSARPTGGEKSTGLGLAIAKKIIHLHGGQVGVKSVPGKGSTFYFLLPV